ncbi:hypothetical protein [Amycolatopsis sp. 195334CR]|uniref:hypothetical protein n=1 Tax=Amycolatopsis sp. 195334CR TaxID=2814588 RepID=UPI001A8E75D4|nr:hypothetical protein [Amycolatopsis sp. 195334CR]MBN6034054.1 hypothetical protein [Amycolatopsis sp. 195334CR]
MTSQIKRARARLAAQKLSPSAAADDHVPQWRPPAGEVDPAVVLAPRAGLGRRRVLAAAGLAVAVAAGAVVTVNQVLGSSTATVPTPPLLALQPAAAGADPVAALRELADRARRQPSLAGEGPVLYSERAQWSFVTNRNTKGEFLGSELAQTRIQSWLGPDGAGREIRAMTGHGALPPLERPLTGQPYAPGTDPAALVAQFRAEGQGQPAHWWLEATLRWGPQLHSPATASAFLQVLAEQPGIRTAGRTTDRAGRPATVFSVTRHLPGDRFPDLELYLLLDPDTGLLLGTESVALTADTQERGYSVATPATTDYLLWEYAARVPDLTSQPRR